MKSLLVNKSPKDVLSLYQRYRAGENVQTMVGELGVSNITDSHFFRIFSAVRVNELNCPLCGVAMLANLPSKKQPVTKVPHTCPACGHIVNANIDGTEAEPYPECGCISCSKVKTAQQAQVKRSFADKIRAAYANQAKCSVFGIDEVRLSVLIGLRALADTWAAEDLSYILPLKDRVELLWPTDEKTASALGAIYHSHLINIDLSHSKENDFVEKDDGRINWYTKQAATTPSIYYEEEDGCLDVSETSAYLDSLLPDQLTDRQKRELPKLMLDIAVDECVQNLQFIMEEYGFEYDTGEKTEQMFAELLQKLPVNQIYVCIWGAVKSAAAFLQSPNCKGRKHAYNTINGKILDSAQRRISGEHNSKGFDRHRDCPRSEISKHVYGLLDFDGDIGFETILSEIPIPDNWLPGREEREDDQDESESNDYLDSEYLMLSEEDTVLLQSHGFRVWGNRFVAEKTLNFTGYVIKAMKAKTHKGMFYELAVAISSDQADPPFVARLSDTDALVHFLGIYEKAERLAEMLSE